MYIQDKNANGITLVPISTRLLANRKIFIQGEINTETANLFVEQVMYLNEENSKRPIDVFINSQGGEIACGMMMYDVIQSSKAPIRIFCIGMAYSMGAVLLACGQHGRYILPNAEVMVHEPLLSSGIHGNATSIRSISDSLLEVRSKMNRILSKHTGRTIAEIEKATAYDHYMSPEESVEFGLCDKVMTFADMMEVEYDVQR